MPIVQCGTLDYRSTGFTLDNFEVTHKGGDGLVVNVKHAEDADIRVHISQNYQCGLFANKCCLQHCQTQLWHGDKEQYFDRDSTCECVAAHSVKEQKCKDYEGDGWCGVHVKQYQKNEGPGMTPEHYRYTVNIKDATGKPIGEHDLVPIPSGEEREFDSLLPKPFKIYSPDVDSDAIWMHYGDQHFTSNDQPHHCNFGKYDNGKREGDCGFSC